ncbi:GNAT family N-acetyltransferase [Glaciihabitans sp. dw_435]|uniref:GNAT family N-acetyltransferase n=1 Tax=Glaciihabitans sp. dw_435 TaxID=2720081 RepID=UPI001BD28429|nr:GNAT family N-acetyltransferase [Glaciihabitans sp. dw_435]
MQSPSSPASPSASSPDQDTAAIITVAATEKERAAVRAFLTGQFGAEASRVIPSLDDDKFFASTVLQAATPTGKIIGTIVTRRSPMAVAYYTSVGQGLEPVDYELELERVSYLDIMAVAPGERRRGVGTALIAALEERLRAAGVKIWFGGIGNTPESVPVADYFQNRGFQVLAPGNLLPSFLGRRWTLPHSPQPRVWFYKQLKAAAK